MRATTCSGRGKPQLKRCDGCLQIVASLNHCPRPNRVGVVRRIAFAGAVLLIGDVGLQEAGVVPKALEQNGQPVPLIVFPRYDFLKMTLAAHRSVSLRYSSGVLADTSQEACQKKAPPRAGLVVMRV